MRPDANRDATVVALFAGGATQSDIAAVTGGVSRARIGQILNRCGVMGVGGSRPIDALRVIAVCRRPHISSWSQAAVEFGKKDSRTSMQKVAGQLGMAPAIDRLFRCRQNREQRAFHEERRAELVEQYRALAARLGRIPTGKDLRPTNGVSFWVTFYRYFRDIRELREAAGMNAKDRRGGSRGPHVNCKRGHLLSETRDKWGRCGVCRDAYEAERAQKRSRKRAS